MLSTDDVPPCERARLVIDALHGTSTACQVTHLCDEESVWARWHHRRLSASTDAVFHQGSALRFRRSARGPLMTRGRLSFTVAAAAGDLLWQHGSRRLDRGDLFLVDLAAPFDYRAGAGTRSCVQIDPAALGLTAATARAAAPVLRSSPLYTLARDHVRAVAAEAAKSTPSSWDDVGAATTDLLAALLLSCEPRRPW